MAVRTLVVIPARMASTRLPGKPLADIAGKPMILHVAGRAREAGIGPVLVATDSPEIAEVVRAAGTEVVMTSPDHPSGSDRVDEAVRLYDAAGSYDCVLNLQGDLPGIDPAVIRTVLTPLEDGEVGIGTLAARVVEDHERSDSNVVKVVGTPVAENRLRALYFTRATAPHGDGDLWHHIGLYAWRREALERFVSLPPSPLEIRERLEQLRALEAGMRIDVGLVDTVPAGVDTPADLERARLALAR